jgi:C2H2 type zinc finger protein
VPSIVEEESDRSLPLSCPDFLGEGGDKVKLYCDWSFISQTRDLIDRIKNNGYRACITDKAGAESALEAIQKGTSFHQRGTGPLPLTIPQLIANLRQIRMSFRFNLGDDITTLELRKILDIYGQQRSEPFNLGVIFAISSTGDYKVDFYFPDGIYGHLVTRTIWVLHRNGPPETWSAVIPEFTSPPISYAAAVKATPQPSSQARAGLLSPSAAMARGKSNSSQRNAPTSWPMVRSTSGSASRLSHRRVPDTSKRQHRLHTPSECGSTYSCDKCNRPYETASDLKHHQRKYGLSDKNHKCPVCGRAFMYPKDRNRHQQTHSKAKPFVCQFCSKQYTRKDNLQRHIRDDHQDRTPPEPLPIP